MHDWLAILIQAVLAKAGANAAVSGRSLLHLATALGRLDLVLWLIEQGAEVDGQDTRGRTPLFFAANQRLARALLEAGANPRHIDLQHHSPLHAAVRAGRLDVAHALKLAGADLNAQDKRGLAPLHAAAMKGRVPCTHHLLRLGANPNVQDRRGRHPLFYAVAGGHFAAAAALMEGGADVDMLDDEGTPWISLARMDQIAPLQACAARVLEAEAQADWSPFSPRRPPRVRYAGALGEQSSCQAM